MRTTLCLALLGIPFFGIASNAEQEANDFFGLSEVREWNANGHMAKGSFVRIDNGNVVVRLENGTEVSANRNSLSDDDLVYVYQIDPSILRSYEIVGTFNASLNDAFRIPKQVKVFVSNDDRIRFEGDGFRYEIPYGPDFWNLFLAPDINKDSVSLVKPMPNSSLKSEICKKRREFADRHSIELNLKWETNLSIPWNEASKEDREMFPILFMSDNEAAKLGNMKDAAAVAFKKAWSNPRFGRILRLVEKKKKEINFENIEKKYDKFFDVTRFETKRNTMVNLSTRQGASFRLEIWFSELENIKMSFVYDAPDWLFVESVVLLAGDKRLFVSFKDTKHKVVSGGVIEVGTSSMPEESLKQIKSIVDSDEVACRLVGHEGVEDVNLTIDQIIAMREMLAYHAFLQQQQPATKPNQKKRK